MNSNKLLLVIFILPLIVLSQELDYSLWKTFKGDDVIQFEKIIKTENIEINQCFKVKNSTYNLLALSIKINTPKIFERLLEKMPDIEAVCSGKTALMYASKYGRLEMAKKLVKKGANLKATNKGQTALDYAKKYEKQELINYLKQQLD